MYKKTNVYAMVSLYLFSAIVAFSSLPVIATNQKDLPVIPDLSGFVLTQQTPQGKDVHREFYANNVELEPFTITLCGKVTQDKSGNIIYKKVPASAIYNLRFYAGAFLTLDSQYNPHNTIPVIHNASTAAPLKPDNGEPEFSLLEANKRRVLLIYDETSNYFKLYKKEGFYLGGTSPSQMAVSSTKQRSSRGYASPMFSTQFSTQFSLVGETGNVCFPDQRPGVGETTVNLYLLATKALENTPAIKIFVIGRPDTKSKKLVTEGPLDYAIPSAPQLNIKNFLASKNVIAVELANPANFYSYFSAYLNLGGVPTIEEEKGLDACQTSAGADFHGLSLYTDNRAFCHNTPKTGPVDCNMNNCSRQIDITHISSNDIPIHDLYTSTTIIGAQCPNVNGALVAGLILKPILNSMSKTKDTTDNFYRSLTGGVGAYFYVRNNGTNNNFHRMTDGGVSGGSPNTFYFFSYEWGITPSPGNVCNWNQPTNASGHDVYGNPLFISFIPANGKTDPKVINVSG